ncbi:hypothetical protein [Deinococcus altitudinis]|uniref:hypothetical protein n=1 Tax=Deinococcus altitudinis TaxID=468914 RepID=UPI00389255CF
MTSNSPPTEGISLNTCLSASPSCSGSCNAAYTRVRPRTHGPLKSSTLKITNVGPLYTVTIHRRWYKPQTIRDIKVRYDDCGPAKATRVVVRLQPIVGAPVIREFHIANVNSDNRMGVGYWPYFQRYETFLDAPGSVSRDVVWTSSRPDVATIDSGGMLRSVCSREPARTTITATLKADPKSTSFTYFSRGGRGMVCKRGAVDR